MDMGEAALRSGKRSKSARRSDGLDRKVRAAQARSTPAGRRKAKRHCAASRKRAAQRAALGAVLAGIVLRSIPADGSEPPAAVQ